MARQMASNESISSPAEISLSDFSIGPDDQSLLLHNFHPAVDEVFIQLEIRNAIAEKSANGIFPLEKRYGMSGFIQ